MSELLANPRLDPELEILTAEARGAFGSLFIDQQNKALNLRAEAEHLLDPATRREALLQNTRRIQEVIRQQGSTWFEASTESSYRAARNQAELTDITEAAPEKLQERAESAASSNQGLADIYDFKAKNTLKRVRGELSAKNPLQSEYLDVLLNANSEFSPFLKSLKPQADTSWTTWLANIPEDGGATDEQLMNMLQWHTDYLDRMNGGREDVDYAAEAFKQSKDSFTAAAEAGLLPEEIIAGLKDATQGYIAYDDLFGLATELRYGYAYPEKGAIYLPGPEQIKTRLHEFTHIYIGTMYPDGVPKAGKRWLDEAITETIASIAQSGKAESVYEFEDGKFYSAERKLLASILNTPDCPLTIDGLIQTYCSGTPEEKQEVFNTIDTIIGQYTFAGNFYLEEEIEALGVNPLYNGNEELYLVDLSVIIDGTIIRRKKMARLHAKPGPSGRPPVLA